MRRTGWPVVAVVALVQSMGCNRQDADALSKIGQMLVERVQSMPIATPQAKPSGAQPQANAASGNHTAKNNSVHQ